jgi:hypothetical protein
MWAHFLFGGNWSSTTNVSCMPFFQTEKKFSKDIFFRSLMQRFPSYIHMRARWQPYLRFRQNFSVFLCLQIHTSHMLWHDSSFPVLLWNEYLNSTALRAVLKSRSSWELCNQIFLCAKFNLCGIRTHSPEASLEDVLSARHPLVIGWHSDPLTLFFFRKTTKTTKALLFLKAKIFFVIFEMP